MKRDFVVSSKSEVSLLEKEVLTRLVNTLSLPEDRDLDAINLIQNSSLIIYDELLDNSKFRWSVFSLGIGIFFTIVRTFVSPVIQALLSVVIMYKQRNIANKDFEIAFISFSANHTKALLPIIRNITKDKVARLKVFRGALNIKTIKEASAQGLNGYYDCFDNYINFKIVLSYYKFVLRRLIFYIPKLYIAYRTISKEFRENELYKFSITYYFFKWLLFYTSMSYMMLLVSKRIFSSGTKVLVFGYDNCPRGRTLVQIARNNGIPTIVIQHGSIASVDNYIPYADVGAIWTENDKNLLMQKGVDESRLLVTGSPKHSYKTVKTRSVNEKNQFKVVLATTKGLRLEYLEKKLRFVINVLEKINNSSLVIRPHPLENAKIYERLKKKNRWKNIIVRCDGDFESHLEGCNLGMVFYSTVTIDFLLNGIPVITLLENSETDPTGMKDHCAVKKISCEQDLLLFIEKEMKTDTFWTQFEKNREKFLLTFAGELQNNSVEIISKLILSKC